MLRRFASWLERGLFAGSQVTNKIAMGLLPVMMLLTVADVFLRRFLGSPIKGTVELTEFALGIVVFLALAQCAVERGHVVVDVLVSRFPQRTRASIDAIMVFFSAGMSGLISWRLFLYAMRVQYMGEVSASLGIWLWPFVFIAGVGFILLSVVYLIQLVYALREVLRR